LNFSSNSSPAQDLTADWTGYQDLPTTKQYMHLSPAALGTAVRLLDFRRERGDILETGGGEIAESGG
jgi:hypothetical protein